MNNIIGDVLDHLQPVNNSLLTELLVLKISQLLNTLYTIEILQSNATISHLCHIMSLLFILSPVSLNYSVI